LKDVNTKQDPRSRIPSINKLADMLRRDHSQLSQKAAIHLARHIAGQMRSNPDASLEKLKEDLVQHIKNPGPRRVINGTGILLHTNLGRSPLDPSVIEAAFKQVMGFTDLEFDRASGKRGHRDRHFSTLAQLIWGVEDGTLVNNAAAAVSLSLAAIAGGRQTVVSRGELIEIGGSFRLPDIMELAGTQLVEIGATNKTKPEDYRRAINSKTGCLLKTHTSNYRIEGFTAETSLAQITEIGREHQVPVIMDLGSGLSRHLPFPSVPEPFIEDYLEARPDLLIFSGDKLFGGVQAGIILGSKKAIATLRKHPMMRMLRQDKLSISIICHQLRDTFLERANPFSELATAQPQTLRTRAEAIVRACPNLKMKVVEDVGYIGGGSLPQEERASVCVEIHNPEVHDLAQSLRLRANPLIGYVRHDKLYINLASVFPSQDEEIVTLLKDSQGK